MVRLPKSFLAWQAGLKARGVLPVIAVAGSRGKSTVVHLLAKMLAAADLRTATWTDEGVRVLGRKQRGELLPWSRALAMLAEGGLDVAIQELDWDTVHAVGLPRGAYPVVGVTNLCANSDACLLREETIRAVKALRTIREAADPEAVFVLNGDDWAVAGGDVDEESGNLLVTVSRDTPLVRSHLHRGGLAGWLEGDHIRFGGEDTAERLLPLSDVAITRNGLVGFQTINALVAVALARCLGLPGAAMGEALRSFTADPDRLPGSFNILDVHGATVVVDRPAAPWFLRQPLRAVGHLPSERQVRVVGRLEGIADDDLAETGRLLGRGGGLVIIHDDVGAPHRREVLLQGISANDVPPVIVHNKSEMAALSALMRVLRADDAVYVLADDPRYVLRRLKRAGQQRDAPSAQRTDGVAPPPKPDRV